MLDDAWRLALAEAPLLLAMAGLFAVPAAAALLLLLTQAAPASPPGRYALPALTALLLPLTGLGSGACQELFRRRAAGERVTLGACLRAALRRGPQHAAGRALVLLGVGLGSLVLAQKRRGRRRVDLNQLPLRAMLHWLLRVVEAFLGVKESVPSERPFLE